MCFAFMVFEAQHSVLKCVVAARTGNKDAWALAMPVTAARSVCRVEL